MELVKLRVADLEVCDRTRVRKIKPKENSEIVIEYAEAYECGLITAPLDVFRERGTERYTVADGEHRLLALRRAGIETVECRLHEGDEIAALDFAISCNQSHGLRRTKADKYHAFCQIMETPALRAKYRTDTELSEKIGVSIPTIQRYKAEWRNSEGGDARVRARKDKARESAAKNTPKTVTAREGTLSNDKVQVPERTQENPPATRIDVPQKRELTNEQRRIAREVREAHRASAPSKPRVDRQRVVRVRQTIGALRAELPPPEEFVATGEVNWADIEALHDWCTAVLENR